MKVSTHLTPEVAESFFRVAAASYIIRALKEKELDYGLVFIQLPFELTEHDNNVIGDLIILIENKHDFKGGAIEIIYPTDDLEFHKGDAHRERELRVVLGPVLPTEVGIFDHIISIE